MDKYLQSAILAQPQAEKDKLLLRLIAKDEVLAEQLKVKLLEDASDLKERRQEIRKRMEAVSRMHHDTPGWMMMDMRDLSGLVNHHVKVTKDKYGEVELQLFLLLRFFENQPEFMNNYTRRSENLAKYVANKAAGILKKMEKLHEDYQFEFEEDVNRMLKGVHAGVAKNHAKELKLPQQWG